MRILNVLARNGVYGFQLVLNLFKETVMKLGLYEIGPVITKIMPITIVSGENENWTFALLEMLNTKWVFKYYSNPKPVI